MARWEALTSLAFFVMWIEKLICKDFRPHLSQGEIPGRTKCTVLKENACGVFSAGHSFLASQLKSDVYNFENNICTYPLVGTIHVTTQKRMYLNYISSLKLHLYNAADRCPTGDFSLVSIFCC